MIIDAKDLILGRVGTVAAKKALLGETIDIVNVEEIVITGSKNEIVARYKHKKDRGQPITGPFISTKEDRFVKRAIRGMLPYRQEKGLSAFKRIKCHIGVPEALKEKKSESLKMAHVSKMPNLKFMRVKELCRLLGRNS